MIIDLPHSEISYHENFWSKKEATLLLEKLKSEIQWQQKTITLFGKTHLEPRLTAWYGDEGKIYTYSNSTMFPHKWNKTLITIKNRIENIIGIEFNSVLLNYYRHGKDGMGWHSDNEPELGKNPVIASASFGGERRFLLKPRDKNQSLRKEIILRHGSLLIMAGETQHYWLHQIPKTSKPVSERINLTFRWIK
ncbi:alpha-ketoglutarate-dependent dioxygenase AlkB [Cyanobacterium aponinum UTEX 3221]|uniref:alpha-ketoglutarate-dependent dioxygenase AlkB family protein n=1 Tax=Cyanobacterium aponinum TaxID=379064 RepID=UPI002B4BB196|nr:alpha-ketoglutarate-dependent dioxygenase AlkB [Cyanobacterium aponinum]WRL37147.1 alpha-ketoglutarate-dependent dioxygenase AlkB [Cyanobacterium aponinum UTEX 3221]